MKDWDKKMLAEAMRLIRDCLGEILEHGYGDLRVVVSEASRKIIVYRTLTHQIKPGKGE